MGKRKHRRSGGGSGGGMLSGLRGGFKGLASPGGGGKGKPQTPLQKALDVLLWVAVAVAFGWFFYKRCV